ncbi:MAG: hypothetical protein R3B70_45235 [Polyangiaceae bacterium]
MAPPCARAFEENGRCVKSLPLIAFALVALVAAGCLGFDELNDCSYNITLPCYYENAGGSGGTGGGGTGGAPPSCIPSNQLVAVDDACGVFVSPSGDDANDGTKEAPFATIAKAMGASKSKPIYLCGATFTEAVEINAGKVFYGALDCEGDWTYAASKPTELTAPSDTIPVRVSSKTSVELYDVKIRAADATVAGGSSIALLAEAESDVGSCAAKCRRATERRGRTARRSRRWRQRARRGSMAARRAPGR